MQLFDDSFRILSAGLAASNLRQQALANNIANVNTPGYRRVDVPFEQQLLAASKSLAEGDVDALDSVSFAPQVDTKKPVRLDGSNVEVDQEMALMSENEINYQAMLQMVREHMGVLRNVISEGRSA